MPPGIDIGPPSVGVMNQDYGREMFGDAYERLVANDMDIGALRPWRGRDGRNYIARNLYNPATGKMEKKTLVTNAPATLPYDAYKLFDDVIIRALMSRLRLVADVRSEGLTYNVPDPMGTSIIQYQTMSDISRASVSMDPARRSEGDRPEMDVAFFPVPFIHKDFDFNAVELAAARRGGIGLDTSTAELAATKVAEEMERMAVGQEGGVPFNHGGAFIYGLINFPQRATKTDMTVPTGANGSAVLNDFLTLRQLLIDNKHFGPYKLYVNTQWSQVLDTDFSASKGQNTLRQRILALPDIRDIETLDFLPSTRWQVVLVELNTQTIRAVIGIDAQTIQWESLGGMRKHFKVLAKGSLQLRADTAGNSGIAHGRSAA